MPGARRGQLRAAVGAAALLLAAMACASTPPPTPARALSVRGVFDCGLSVMAGSGWELSSPPGGPRIAEGHEPAEPEYLIAALDRGGSQLSLTVRRTDRGQVTVEVGHGLLLPRLAEEDRLEQQITGRCMS